MTILQVITKSELGGAQSVVTNLANKLVDNHKVIVVAGEGDGRMFDELDSRIVKIRCNTLVRAVEPLNELRTIRFFRKVYREYNPDIIHLHSSKAGLLGRLAFPSSKVIYTIHGFDSIRLAFRKFLPLERILQKRCKAIVSVSQYDCHNLMSEGINHNVSLVYNGVKECSADNAEMANALPSRFTKKVLCIARLAPPKNSKLFMEVAERLPDVAFVWIGNLQNVESHPENVFFWGNIPYSGRQCRFFDVFMLPSDYEGLPIVILEAMSCGLPIVASDVGGISEIVRDGENGYTLPNKADMFTDKLKYILGDESVRSNMGKKSREIYDACHNETAMLNGYMQLYTK